MPGADCSPEEMTAVLGHCVDADSGRECFGSDVMNPVFEELADGAELAMVTGPQGSQMFVFSVRARGIGPGDGVSEPISTVSVDVFHADDHEAAYEAQVTFRPDGGADTLLAQGLFVALQGDGFRFVGETMDVAAAVQDETGTRSCGELSFVAAESL